MSFDPCNRLLTVRDSIRTPTSQSGGSIGSVGFIPSHTLALPGSMKCDSRAHSWPAPLQTLSLVMNPRLRLQQDIVEVQTLGGIILLGGDFNVCTTTLLDTIDINDLCELLQASKLVEIKQLNVVVKQ